MSLVLFQQGHIFLLFRYNISYYAACMSVYTKEKGANDFINQEKLNYCITVIIKYGTTVTITVETNFSPFSLLLPYNTHTIWIQKTHISMSLGWWVAAYS